MLHRGAADGQKLQVNDLLAIIGNQGEDVSALVAQYTGGSNGQPPAEAPAQPQQQATPAVPAACYRSVTNSISTSACTTAGKQF
ncbi:MAG: hypothetical protein WKG06_46920 [Segetibacter sp.]